MKKTTCMFILFALNYSSNFVYGMKRPLEPDQNDRDGKHFFSEKKSSDINLEYFLNKKTFSEQWLFLRDLITTANITTLDHLLKNINAGEKSKLINHTNVIGRNLFHIAKEKHSFPIALLLCAHGANAYSIPPAIPPLIQAIYYNDIEKVQKLIETLDKDKADKIKSLALFVASYEGHTYTAQVLLDNATNINTPNSYGDSALMMACANGHVATAELLIKQGADINAVNKDKTTALMLAATNGHVDIARLLLDNNADTYLFNIHNKNALRLAQEQKKDTVVNLLLEEYEIPWAILLLAKQAKENMIVEPIAIDLTKQLPLKKQPDKRDLRSTKRNNAAIVLTNPKKPCACTFPKCTKSYKNKYTLKTHIDNKHS